MKTLVSMSFELRLAVVFLLGTAAGSFVNWARYAFTLDGSPLSPWCREHPHDERSRWLDRLPLVGWWRLRRKGKQLGYDFWLRPFTLELVVGAFFAALYIWEIGELGLVFQPRPDRLAESVAFMSHLHAQFAAHALLITFMLAASLVDFHERIIPDEITVPGTLIGLAWMTLVPWSALPDDMPFDQLPLERIAIVPLQLASPWRWPTWLNGAPNLWPLVIALACLGGWCFALLPRTWRGRRGWRWAVKLILARLARDHHAKIVFGIGVLDALAIGVVWFNGGPRWEALLSSLLGMAFGGGAIWAIRLLGAWTLRREAMGFGDVTLMAMIGVYLGWQPILPAFGLAACIGFFGGIVQFFYNRDGSMPFGPYLCLGALAVIVGWVPVWNRFQHYFNPPGLIPVMLALCLVVMAPLLAICGLVRRRFWPES
jgi:leader peptidase (prepilin peptidase) / N-methyltransferase